MTYFSQSWSRPCEELRQFEEEKFCLIRIFTVKLLRPLHFLEAVENTSSDLQRALAATAMKCVYLAEKPFSNVQRLPQLHMKMQTITATTGIQQNSFNIISTKPIKENLDNPWHQVDVVFKQFVKIMK